MCFNFFFSSRRRHTRCALVTGVQTCALPISTIVYDLLCLDPAARAPREWEWYIPWPAPEIETFATDPRIAQVQSIYEHWLKPAPQLADITRLDCTQPGECNTGMILHFGRHTFHAEFGGPDRKSGG